MPSAEPNLVDPVPQNAGLLASSYRYQAVAFGHRWQSDIPLHAFPQDHWQEMAEPGHAQAISVRLRADAPPRRGVLRHNGRFHLKFDGFRYLAGEVATVDVYGKDRVDIHPGPEWAGVMPSGFFSSVAGMLMAANGCLPLHGSAVSVDGEATIVCGRSGAGKSTTIARMIERGALLISDDLTVLHPDPAGGQPVVFAGRRSIRLFPGPAEAFGKTVAWQEPPRAAAGKVAVFPPRVLPDCPVPLTRVIFLGQTSEAIAASSRGLLLADQLFRSWLLHSTYGHGNRLAVLAIAARNLEFIAAPAL